MTCEHCEKSVEEAVVDVENVTAAEADRDMGSVTIEGDPDIDTVVDAVTAAGYDASVR